MQLFICSGEFSTQIRVSLWIATGKLRIFLFDPTGWLNFSLPTTWRTRSLHDARIIGHPSPISTRLLRHITRRAVPRWRSELFFRARHGFWSVFTNATFEARTAMKYMLLSKIMSNQPKDDEIYLCEWCLWEGFYFTVVRKPTPSSAASLVLNLSKCFCWQRWWTKSRQLIW